MGNLREPDQTDELRRLALQLALQLPASVGEARRVLELTSECLDEFLIEKAESQSAAARARRIWGRRRPPVAEAAPAPAMPPRLAVLLCCLGALGLSTALGAGAVRLVGYGPIGLNLLTVTTIALLFGRGAALAGALLAFVLTSWAVMPPAFDLGWPTVYELCGLALYVLAAVAIPWIQSQRDPLREASLRAVSAPWRGLRRRAA